MAANFNQAGVGGRRRRRQPPPNNQFGWNVSDYTPRRIEVELVADVQVFVLWLQFHNLIATTFNCRSCGTVCRFARQNATQDGCVWRCPNRMCRRWFNIRAGSFFQTSKMSLANLVRFIYYWSLGTMRYVDIEQVMGLGVCDWKTLVDWSNFLREVCGTK